MPGKRDLTLLFGVRLLSAMGVTLILPVMPAMARTFGLSIAEAGMVVVCFTLAEATMTPVAGVLSDRSGSKLRNCAPIRMNRRRCPAARSAKTGTCGLSSPIGAIAA